MQNQEDNISEENQEKEPMEQETDIKADNAPITDEKTASEEKLKELNDKYLRLYSEFDNYRKRTMKEKSDITKTASEDVFKAILPVIDDFERAIKANENIKDGDALKEGFQLIFNKLKNTIQQKGLTSFETIGQAFDPDVMEAITNVAAADDSQKGKVVDEVEKGYKLGDKVIRFAKVVIAQ